MTLARESCSKRTGQICPLTELALAQKGKATGHLILLGVIPELSVGTFVIVYPLLEYMRTCSCGHYVLDSLS